MLTKLVNAGMNVMRLNFSHGNSQEHGGRISRIREVMAETGKRVAIPMDTGDLKSAPLARRRQRCCTGSGSRIYPNH